ncbi:PREDICTED: GDSL esterase/lipase At5g03610-like [Prunus mume]|uniref:GDSL esterase/lipase At5g03610-like n=1 Tax=Prunus mume TaxID=102107 RepID=A0ABM1LQL7_PRUMU|nr:PREDICTED: GDSL esterase/lipase At5g03610-like [Prunus mume]
MEKQTTIASSCLFLLYITTFTVAEVLEAHHHLHQHNIHGSVKLFVFGDSYVDTGNIRKSVSPSWKEPYGITFPGKPAGRFSNGRVLTDYIASFLGIRSPVPYALRKFVKKSKLESGMNFAFGGTGVFDTLVSGPNLTTQIDFFEHLLQQKVYAKNDVIKSSIALVSVAGNNYAAHFGRPGNDTKDLAMFTKSIIKQLTVDLKRIHDLGVQKIAVTTIEPLGCLPSITSFLSYQNCNEFANMASMFHNQILLQKLEELNKETKNSAFVDLDLYNAFISAVKPPKHHQGYSTFQINTLKPCCVGVSNEYSCGSVDQTGAKKYIVCDNPDVSFFWDTVHPSQNGWHEVYAAIKPSLHQLCS